MASKYTSLNTINGEEISKITMNLFGAPYQFSSKVDPRVGIINKTIGKKYMENIMLDAPICTIIPGEPSYLPLSSASGKVSTAIAMLEANDGFTSALSQIKNDRGLDKLYDFKNNYTEYMKYVNVLCRTGAVFLGLNNKTYNINGEDVNFASYDWRKYRWTTDATKSMRKRLASGIEQSVSIDKSKGTLAGVGKKVREFMFGSAEDTGNSTALNAAWKNYNYVQFYIDGSVDHTEGLSNSTNESQLKSLFDGLDSKVKEIAFWANSGGIDATQFSNFASESFTSIAATASSLVGNNALTGMLSRIINLGADAIKGNNISIPKYYDNSSRNTSSHSITVHLRSPYGSLLGYYMDIFVPMMHLMALAMPRQATANSFGSPFLVKCYVDGIFTCNLGIVTDISISKVSDSWSVNGLPSEVDVSLSIEDLYSDLAMSPSSSPTLFVNNSSLIEYLATNCGLSLTNPQINNKIQNVVNAYTNAITDIPENIKSAMSEKISSLIAGSMSLY